MVSALRVPEVEPTVADQQVFIEHLGAELEYSYNDGRDWVTANLPASISGAIEDALFLMRRLVLPTGKDVGVFGDADCVAANDCAGKDLTGAQLNDQNLSGVDWTGAVLTDANLRNASFGPSAAGTPSAASTNVTANAINNANANLTGADLRGADLRGANMSGTNLTNANLTGAILTNANLTGANLTGANLTGANLTWATLINANLTGTDHTGAYFGGANLTDAIGTIASPHFQVQLGTATISVQEVSGLDVQAQPIEYRTGSSAVFSAIKMPGLKKPGNVTMKNGIFTSGDKFSDWFNQIKTNTSTRQSLTITLIDAFDQPTMTWTLAKAVPTKITGAISEGNETAFATVEIAFDSVNITYA